MRLLALTKYGHMAASTRQRFAQYQPALESAGISVDYAPLFDNAHIERLTAGRRASPVAVLLAYANRLRALLGAWRYDVLWVHCELFPYWPGFLERLVGLWGKPVVFDYDDAIFHMYDASPRRVVRWFLGVKLAPLLRKANVCCCGNQYLRDYASRYCSHAIVLPTVVDTDRYRPMNHSRDGPLVIGWIGSPSTWAFVRPILPILRTLVAEHGVVIRVVGAGDAAEIDRFPGLELVRWTEDSEIAAVQSMDIGIMPLGEGKFERGKCGYKLIQYMACGLPVVASPVGVNSEIVVDDVNGFLAGDANQWRSALERLVVDPAMRSRFGQAGRARTVEAYSLHTHAPRLLEIIKEASGLR